MPDRKHDSRTMFFAGLIAVSLLVGWFIPAFYAWTDSDQSRPSPLLWQVPLAAAIAFTVFSFALPWLPILKIAAEDEPHQKVRFQLRTLLGITAVVAVMLAMMAKFPFGVSCVVSAGTFAYFIRFCIRNPHHRLPAASLIACMVLPYVWIVGYDEFDRILPTVFWMIAGFPAFLPGAIVSGFLGQRFADNLWPGVFLTAIELGFGIWLIRLGPKRTIAYLLFVMLSSAMGSLVFYQLCRA